MPMKTIEGYSKEKYTDASVLLAGGGTKALSDFMPASGSYIGGTTVADVKANLLNYFRNKPATTTAYTLSTFVSNFGNDSYTILNSSVCGFIALNPGYDNYNHGHFLVSEYGSNRLRHIGLGYNTWYGPYTIAYTSDIPTKVSQLTNDSGYLTSLPSHNHDDRYVNVTGDTMTGPLTIDFNHTDGGVTYSLLNVLFNGTHDYGIVAKFHSYGGDSPAIRFSHSSNKSEYNSLVNTNWSIGMRYNTYTDFAITQDRGTNGWGTVRFAINNSGNVGIGVDSASYKLHVAGDIYANGGWLRSSGSTGWYNESYGGGWYMEDSTYIRVYNSKRVYNSNTSQYAFYTSGGMTALGHMYSNSSACSWIAGQNATNAALNIGDATDTGSYWPWFRQTNTSSAKWFSVGTLNNSLYFIGSATSRTANSYDYGFRMDFSNGYLYGNFSGYLSGTASSVTINYNNDSNSTYQILWGSENYVYGTSGIYCNPYTDTIYATTIKVNRAESTTGFFLTSDFRKKNILGNISEYKAYDFVKNCKPIVYELKDDETHDKQLGLIAQEVEEYFPELVITDENGFKSMDYSRLSVVLFTLLKDLIKRNKL